jgi:hypothetical protein
MHIKEQPRSRLEFVQALPNEHSIRAKVNVLFAEQDLVHKPPKFGIDERFAAANRYDRRAALIERLKTLFDTELFANRVGVFANAATARTGEIAGMERLEHHDKRKFLRTTNSLVCNVAGHAGGKCPGESQEYLPGR